MIYEQPKCSPGGDRFILLEFGDELNLELNFFAQGMGRAVAEQNVKGVIETAPCFASLLVHYEPDEISYGDLEKELIALAATLGKVATISRAARSASPAMSIDETGAPKTATRASRRRRFTLPW